jgi:hypothetical protein
MCDALDALYEAQDRFKKSFIKEPSLALHRILSQARVSRIISIVENICSTGGRVLIYSQFVDAKAADNRIIKPLLEELKK